jgi:hypothetical protein
MFSKTMKIIVVKLLLIWINALTCLAFNPIFYAGEIFDEDHVPILANRIFFVPYEKNRDAITLLENRRFVKLSECDLSQLFSNKVFDPQFMITEQAKQAREYASCLEQQATDPFFESSKDWMIKIAKEHKKFADYTDKLPPQLKPYLICAEINYKKTGNFSAYLKGDNLILHYGSLGSKVTDIEKVHFVIFVEKEIGKVIISNSIAE